MVSPLASDTADFFQRDHSGHVAEAHATVLLRSDHTCDPHLGQRLDNFHGELAGLLHGLDHLFGDLGLGQLPNRLAEQFFSFRKAKFHCAVPPSNGKIAVLFSISSVSSGRAFLLRCP
jgi:hypothetical protein